MGEVKKIVTEDATAAELPERFRGSIDPTKAVTVVVTERAEPAPKKRGEARYLEYWGAAAHLGTTTEEAVARVRTLRDEWDDR